MWCYYETTFLLIIAKQLYLFDPCVNDSTFEHYQYERWPKGPTGMYNNIGSIFLFGPFVPTFGIFTMCIVYIHEARQKDLLVCTTTLVLYFFLVLFVPTFGSLLCALFIYTRHLLGYACCMVKVLLSRWFKMMYYLLSHYLFFLILLGPSRAVQGLTSRSMSGKTFQEGILKVTLI